MKGKPLRVDEEAYRLTSLVSGETGLPKSKALRLLCLIGFHASPAAGASVSAFDHEVAFYRALVAQLALPFETGGYSQTGAGLPEIAPGVVNRGLRNWKLFKKGRLRQGRAGKTERKRGKRLRLARHVR